MWIENRDQVDLKSTPIGMLRSYLLWRSKVLRIRLDQFLGVCNRLKIERFIGIIATSKVGWLSLKSTPPSFHIGTCFLSLAELRNWGIHPFGVGKQTYRVVLKIQHIRSKMSSHPPRLRGGFEVFFARFALFDDFVPLPSLGTIAFGPAGGFTPSFGQSRSWLNRLNYSSKVSLHHRRRYFASSERREVTFPRFDIISLSSKGLN